MNNEQTSDSNWREEYKNYTSSKFHLELLENGSTSLAQSWILQSLYQKWKRIKGIPPDPEPPDCSSSLKDSLSRWN